MRLYIIIYVAANIWWLGLLGCLAYKLEYYSALERVFWFAYGATEVVWACGLYRIIGPRAVDFLPPPRPPPPRRLLKAKTTKLKIIGG